MFFFLTTDVRVLSFLHRRQKIKLWDKFIVYYGLESISAGVPNACPRRGLRYPTKI